MESIQTIFLNTIKQNMQNPQFVKILKELSFELSRKKIQRLKDEKKIQDRTAELFEQYCKILEHEQLKNSANISAIIEGLLEAANHDKEEFLYKTIYEIEHLQKSVQKQKTQIQSSIKDTYITLEKHINSFPQSLKSTALEALNDTKLNALEMLGILRETTEEALLTTLEKGKDIEDTTLQITKNLSFQAMSDGEFSKKRFSNITKTIIGVTLELANENLAFNKELTSGAIEGTKLGILKTINKIKNDIQFAPQESDVLHGQNLDTIKRDLSSIEDEYIDILKDFSYQYDGKIHKVLDEKIQKYDSSVEKIKRATVEAKEAISQRLEELTTDVNIDEIKEKAEVKLGTLKKDMEEFGKNANETLENIKQNEKVQKATTEAKKLGLRAWEVAKNILDGTIKTKKDD